MMVSKFFNFQFQYCLSCLLLFASVNCLAIEDLQDREAKAGLRMIGHKVLLNAGDDTSRVLPIENEDGRYKMQFGSPFEFDPAALVKTFTEVVEKTEIASEYLVEVETCDSQKVVYSYKMGLDETTDMVACSGRLMPKACYVIYMSILSTQEMASTELAQRSMSGPAKEGNNTRLNALLIFSFIVLIGTILYFRGKRGAPLNDPDVIIIGDFRFNPRNMTLSHNDESIELTSKEADLLMLLNKSPNKTLERENILNVVWGDEGDYTGRTLDVFISKLRKKLVADTKLKIINIRGVGYRFVVNQ